MLKSMNSKMISTRSVVLACSLLLAALSATTCDVDDSKPDLSMFRLRTVDGSRQTQERLSQPIKDYASGAIMMRRVLFSSDSLVRCSAYAHLLKLIHNVNLEDGQKIRQDTVIALAITADNDREHYGELFKMYQPVVLQETMKEAIGQLERRHVMTPLCRDTWMELINCAVQFELNLQDFLEMPTRASKIENYNKFKAISGAPIEREPRAAVFSEQEILEARLKVERFDNDELSELRDVLRNPKDQTAAVEELMPVDEARDDKDAPKESGTQIDIEVPDLEPEIKFDVVEPNRVSELIHVLDFLKHRVQIIEATPKSRLTKSGKLTLDSALDYVNVWTYLKKLNPDPTDDQAARISGYLRDEQNVRVFERLNKTLTNFRQISEYLAKMKQHEGHWKSMKELEETYEGLIEALNEVNFLDDVYDLTRATLNTRAKELKEFQTMNKFIESDLW